MASRQGAVGKNTDPRKYTGENDLEGMVVGKKMVFGQFLGLRVEIWGNREMEQEKKRKAPTQERPCYLRY